MDTAYPYTSTSFTLNGGNPPLPEGYTSICRILMIGDMTVSILSRTLASCLVMGTVDLG